MEGNQYWKQRKRHGKPRKFTTPEALWQAACNYFEWCDAHPLTKVEYRGRAAKQVMIPLIRPYTLSGFCLHNNIGINYLNQLKAKLGPEEQELYHTIGQIENVIFAQQFEGAAVGIFNPLIIARSFGLKNKTRQEH